MTLLSTPRRSHRRPAAPHLADLHGVCAIILGWGWEWRVTKPSPDLNVFAPT